MMRQRAARRGLLAVLLAGSLMGGALAGCGAVPQGPEHSEETTVDYRGVSEAVTRAVPRVVEVRDPSRSRNGFGYRFSAGLVADSAEPFTPEELDAVVEAIWQRLPWEPNTIKLTAGADTDAGHEIVDLRAAADALDPLRVRDAGQAGVTLTGMASRYGAWAAPE